MKQAQPRHRKAGWHQYVMTSITCGIQLRAKWFTMSS